MRCCVARLKKAKPIAPCDANSHSLQQKTSQLHVHMLCCVVRDRKQNQVHFALTTQLLESKSPKSHVYKSCLSPVLPASLLLLRGQHMRITHHSCIAKRSLEYSSRLLFVQKLTAQRSFFLPVMPCCSHKAHVECTMHLASVVSEKGTWSTQIQGVRGLYVLCTSL